MPVNLAIDFSDVVEKPVKPLTRELWQLYRDGLHCDMALTCGEERFPVHRLVLAATSRVWRERLQSAVDAEIQIADVSQPEAVKLMLNCVYETDSLDSVYEPSTPDVNREVLVLARSFELPQLSELAMRWLAKDVTTADVVEKLRVCCEFKLEVLHGKIIEQLIGNRAALSEVSRSSKIAMYPELMQALLQQAAAKIRLEANTSRACSAKFSDFDEQLKAHQASDKDAGSSSTGRANEEIADNAAESVACSIEAAPVPRRRRSVGKSADEHPPADAVDVGAASKTRKCSSKALEEPAVEDAVEGSPAQLTRRRKSAGKQGDNDLVEEMAESEVVDEVLAAPVVEVLAPKKRLKKGPGK